ncbi:MAG: hypothetical protein LBO74_02785 [Candidatus Symbiothrix sp.]|jgi:hypothetical protein|nr:hypothetical protein [Candidatus Symbiothrix sp.]
MKKFSFIFCVSLICSFAVLTSCKDKDSAEEDLFGVSDITKLNDYSYSDLSVEKQKEKLQGDANGFLSELQGLKTNDGVKVLATFNALLEIDAPQPGFLRASSQDVIYHIADFYGKYTWNASKHVWDYAASTSKEAEFSFPVENKTGKIVASAVSSSLYYEDETWYYDEDSKKDVDVNLSIELPKEVHGKIYLGTAEVGSLHAVSDIKSLTTFPSLSELTYVLGEYTFTSKVAKATPSIAKSTLKNGSKVLIDAEANMSGNVDFFANDTINPGQMNGNVVINLQNTLAFAGIVDFTKYMVVMNEIDEAYYDDRDKYGREKAEENYYKADAKAFNDYINLFLVASKDKAKIATLKSKAKLNERYWGTVPVLVFKDNTEIEAEVFFSSGFDTFLKNLNDFVNSFLSGK